MTKIRVTAILPCFNHSNYLPDRISSVLAQTRPVDEIIFLDDASTDNSVFIARRLLCRAHCPVIISQNATNSGSTFAQWNKGVNLATGELIWIAETDDSCDPCLLETLLNCYQHNRATFAWTQSMVIDEAGTKLHSAREWHERLFPSLFDRDFAMEGDLFVHNYLSCVNLIPNASATLFIRINYIKAGLANELMHYSGDWLQWIKLLQGGRVCFINKELNYFRCHESTTRSNPHLKKLNSENLVCIATALATKTQSSYNINKATEKIIIKPSTILSNVNKQMLLQNLVSNFSLSDIPFLNLRIRAKGGLAFFSTGSLLLLGWLAIIHLYKFRFKFLMSRLHNYKSVFLTKMKVHWPD